MRIRVLPPDVANRIAAGEVIERPASAIKELVENSVDAGAQKVIVAVRGEITSFEVRDNGSGIEKDDIGLALTRYATSKFSGDLGTIGTLGFRGEALPSIASVANVRITTRSAGSENGWQTSANADDISDPRPASHPRGTSVEVEGLFSRHPARLKFMKSRRTELAAIRSAIDGIALEYPDVEFDITLGSTRTVYQPCGYRNDPSAISARAGDVLGDAFRNDAYPVSYEDEGCTVFGSACVPTSTRRDTAGIHLCVNGRYVSDRGLLSAVRSAYAGLIAPGTYPQCFISIRLDSTRVDCNVHPRKTDIRISDQQSVHQAVKEAIGTTLRKSGVRTASSLSNLASDLARPSGATAGDRLRLPLGRVIGQANGSWIVSETMDGIVIVDQHAAHERVILERLRARSQDTAPERVTLPNPVAVTLNPQELAALEDRASVLDRLGLDLTFLPGSVHVATLPAAIGSVDPIQLVKNIAARAVDDPEGDVVADIVLDMLATAACRAAIKAGDHLDMDHADQLLREMEGTPNVSQCNHGRPTVVFLSGSDLERLFARR